MYVVKTEYTHPDYVFETPHSAVTLSRISDEVSIVVGSHKYESAGTWFSPTLAREIAAQLMKLADEIDPPVGFIEPGKPTPVYKDTKPDAAS